MAHGCLESVSNSLKETIRDGGIHGWIAVLGLFTCFAARVGVTKGLGMMLPTLQEQFVTSTWLIGWMVAFVSSGGAFSGILATPLKERFGARTVVIVSGIVAGISMITASFLSSLYAITFLLTVSGAAIGITYIISKHLVGSFFTKSLTTAYGLGSMGSSFAFIAVVPLIQLFLDIYGWRGTMLLLGALLLHIAVCGALMKPLAASGSRDGYEAALTYEEQETGEDKRAPNNHCGCFNKVYLFTRETFQRGLFSSTSFWFIVFISTVRLITYCAWLVYYVQYTTVYKGFTMEDASNFIVAYGIGRAVACLMIAPIIQQVQFVSKYTWLAIAVLILAIYYAVDPWLMSYWPITGNACIFGIAFALTSILIDVVIKEIFGKEQLGHVLGWMGFMTGLSIILLLYVPGLIYDLTGDYTVAFSLMAGAQLLSVAAAFWLHWRHKGEKSFR
ncbi:monocarboxylate transporter 12-like [Asterias amurensis]|uniref:monocarboxylate transporter 12-like n=1 Tax=Asterias amurensis TaxID=7602 RepID=UPI003AB212C1